MGIYVAGTEYSGVNYRGFGHTKVYVGGVEYAEAESPGGILVIGTIDANGVVQRLTATISDRNPISAINSVRFDILRNGVSRLFHVGYSVGTTLPANVVMVDAARLPEGTAALQSDGIRVVINYTDSTGVHNIVGTSGAFVIVDSPGSVSVTASRSGRNRNFAFNLTDINGIRSVTSAMLVASDGQSDNVLSDFTRSNANTFTGTDTRRNARWNSGTLTVTYVDATSGNSHTVSDTWSL